MNREGFVFEKEKKEKEKLDYRHESWPMDGYGMEWWERTAREVSE